MKPSLFLVQLKYDTPLCALIESTQINCLKQLVGAAFSRDFHFTFELKRPGCQHPPGADSRGFYKRFYELSEMMTKMSDHPESKSEVLRKKYEFLVIVLLAVVTFMIYAKTLTGDFLFDDLTNIEHNPHLRLNHITAESLLDASFKGPSKRRPVARLSFALNYYFHGYNVVGFHMVNILIHIANGVLLYLLVNITWRTPAMRPYHGKYGWVAFFTAFIWLVHPIQTQAVSYIVQRMTSLATMFYVLSLLFYIQARIETGNIKKAAWFSAMVVSGILALGSKEISTTLPFPRTIRAACQEIMAS